MFMKTIAAVAASMYCFSAFAGDLQSGVNRANFDPAVKPQDDLFRHVNGKWLSEANIPSDRPAQGAFFELRDLSEERTKAIIEEAAKKEGDADAKKIADLYASFMDEAKAEELGMKPIQSELDAVAAMKDYPDVIRQVAALQRVGVQGLFGAFVTPDAKKADQNIVYLNQGGLGMPDESYYRDAKFEPLRKAYVSHVERMLALAKVPDPQKAAKQIMTMETEIAKGHWDNVKSRDADKTYNKMSRAQLNDSAKGLNLDLWFEGMGGKDVKEVVVRQPSFFTELDRTLAKFTLDDLKTYLAWRVISTRAPLLSKAFAEESFAFTGKTLFGTPEIQPRWKRGVSTVESALGEAVGKLYVEKHFPPEAKARMKELVANLIEAYRVDIQALDWMTSETKAKALAKLSKFTPKIG